MSNGPITDGEKIRFHECVCERLETLLHRHDPAGFPRFLSRTGNRLLAMPASGKALHLFYVAAFDAYFSCRNVDIEKMLDGRLLNEAIDDTGEGRRVARGRRLLVTLVLRGVVRSGKYKLSPNGGPICPHCGAATDPESIRCPVCRRHVA